MEKRWPMALKITGYKLASLSFAFFLFFPLILSAQDKLSIGAIYPLTGPAAHLGESNKRGASLAVKHFNENGGINGKVLQLIIEDSKSDPKTGVSAFQKLTSVNKVPAVLTTLTSVAMSVRPIAERTKTVLFSESTHPKLTSHHDYVFRHFITTASGAKSVVKFMKERGLTKIAVLYQEAEFALTALDEIESRLLKNDITLVAKQNFLSDTSDVRTQLLQLKQAEPDLLYLIGIGPAFTHSFRQRKELSITTPTVGYVICGQREVLNAATPFLDGVYTLEGIKDTSNEHYQYLKTHLEREYPNEPIDQSTIAAYEAVRALASVMRTGAASSQKIQALLSKWSTPKGAMGPISFLDEGNSEVEMQVQVIQNGKCLPLTTNQ